MAAVSLALTLWSLTLDKIQAVNTLNRNPADDLSAKLFQHICANQSQDLEIARQFIANRVIQRDSALLTADQQKIVFCALKMGVIEYKKKLQTQWEEEHSKGLGYYKDSSTPRPLMPHSEEDWRDLRNIELDLDRFIDTPLVPSESDFEADSEFSPASGGSTPQFKFLTQAPSPASIVDDGDALPALDLYAENSSQVNLCQSAKPRKASQPDPWKPKTRCGRKPFAHQRKH